MKTAVIEINPDWKAALRTGAKGIRQAAKSGRSQQATFSYASPELLFSEISPQALGRAGSHERCGRIEPA